jgi:hypothetical protein
MEEEEKEKEEKKDAKLNIIKGKDFFSQKDIIKEMNRQAIVLVKIFTKHTFHKKINIQNM